MTLLTRILVILVALVIVAAVGFLVYLGVRDIPAPTAKIEKVIPNDRFAR